MDSLVSVIGNAAVDPVFREELLKHPVKATDDWGFRLTKGDIMLLKLMFHTDLVPELKQQLEKLGKTLYTKVELAAGPQTAEVSAAGFAPTRCPFRTCMCSVQAPEVYRDKELKDAA
ncbi:MAG TPA: hypothetical protein VFI95_17855 [Terriglobales bacterium]|nr:hypothetical protein [Terriglobales bacterium]